MTPKPSPSPSDPLFEGLTYSRAKNAFWLGFFSLICLGFLTGIPAIFVGAQALSDIDASGGRLRGKGHGLARRRPRQHRDAPERRPRLVLPPIVLPTASRSLLGTPRVGETRAVAMPATETIPALLAAAVERDAGATWLRTDEGTLTFGGAADQVARLAGRLRDAGVGHGDLVLVTARTTPPYVLCWLALASLGAVTVPTDPGATLDELAGLVHQVVPRMIVTDAALRPQVVEARRQLAIEVLDIDALVERLDQRRRRRRVPAGDGRRAGRPGRPHPHLGHHRQVQAGHADAPRLRDGGRRLPVLDGARPPRTD